MLFCSSCFENEASFFDGDSKDQWCNSCVPRGCSCNEELLFYREPQSTFKKTKSTEYEDLIKEHIIDSSHNKKIQICYNAIDEKGHYGTCNTKFINLSQKELDENILHDIKWFTNHFSQSCLKVIPLDDNNKEYPCCEIMTFNNPIEIGEIFFSLEFNEYVQVSEFSNNKKSFKVYSITDKKVNDFIKTKDFQNKDFFKEVFNLNKHDNNNNLELELDYSNPRWYPLNGILDDYNWFDILVHHSMLSEPFFHTIKNIFNNSLIDIIENIDFECRLLDHFDGSNTFSNLLFDSDYLLLRDNLKEQIIKQFKECNIDKQFETKLYSCEQETLDNITTDKNLDRLIELIFKINILSQNIRSNSINDSSIHWGCGCGCGGDMFDDENYVQELEDQSFKNKSLRIEYIKIFWSILNNEDQ